MNLQLSCQVNGVTEYIELGGTDNVTLDISFAEVQDITKKNSAFSKNFRVPGTNGNNYIFEYFFDLNQIPLNFIPTKKFEAQLVYNGYLIASGYIRLNTVTTVKEQKTYDVTFYNGVGDVAAQIGDKFLAQLDLSHLSHPYDSNVWLQSQVDYNLFPLTGTTNYSYQNGKTYWGLYNIGYNYTPSLSGISTYYLGSSSTSVAIVSGSKTITTSTPLPFVIGETIRMTANPSNNFIQGRVTSINGTSITFLPNLGLGTGTYSTWTISRQLTDREEIPDPLTTPIIEFVNSPGYMSFSGTPIRNFYFKPAIQIKELYEQVFEQNGYLIDSNFFNTSYFERFYLPLKFRDETVFTRGATKLCFDYNQKPANETFHPISLSGNWIVQSAITCQSSAVTTNLTGFTIPSSFSSDTENYSGILTFTYNVPQVFNCPTDALDFHVMFGPPSGLTNVFSDTTCNDLGPSYDATAGIVISPQFNINQGFYISGTNIPSIFNVSFTLVSPNVISGNINYAEEFPPNDYKQIDFITSVNKFFNLIVVPDPIKPNTLIVEPIIDYIGKGRILDWTSQIDWNSAITISPTSNLLNGTLNFNFRLDQDYGNQQFNISNNKVFGTYQLQLNQDYKDNNINFDTMFGAETDIALNNSSGDRMTVANMAALKTDNDNGTSNQKFNPYKILPRVLFRGVTLPNDNWGLTTGSTKQTWWAETYQQDRWLENSRFTTYPFSYSGFSHYLNFNAEDTTGLETMFPEQDMYDIYYYDYISDILSPENKIMKAKIYLTPYEIADLRFNEKIIIKNSYWRINKISGYNLTEPSLCDIELIKLTKDYTPHPVQYYDLISCTGGTDYHTTSDLNYNMYAYIGNYVNIFTGSTTAYTSIGCYQVTLGTPNATYDYESVFIGSGYTNSGVSVFSDCGCSATTAFNIVQQT